MTTIFAYDILKNSGLSRIIGAICIPYCIIALAQEHIEECLAIGREMVRRGIECPRFFEEQLLERRLFSEATIHIAFAKSVVFGQVSPHDDGARAGAERCRAVGPQVRHLSLARLLLQMLARLTSALGNNRIS